MGIIGIVVEKIVYGYVKGYVGDYNFYMCGVEVDWFV